MCEDAVKPKIKAFPYTLTTTITRVIHCSILSKLIHNKLMCTNHIDCTLRKKNYAQNIINFPKITEINQCPYKVSMSNLQRRKTVTCSMLMRRNSTCINTLPFWAKLTANNQSLNTYLTKLQIRVRDKSWYRDRVHEQMDQLHRPLLFVPLNYWTNETKISTTELRANYFNF